MHSQAPPRRLLVVEDDHILRLALMREMEHRGFEPVTAATIAEADSVLARDHPALAIVDLGLPDGDGVDVVNAAHGRGVPVIVLTAATDEAERLRAFEAGADDFVPKPFSMAELAARIDAVLRRSTAVSAPLQDGLWLDQAGRRCGVGSEPVELTRTEFDLLDLLIRHRGQVLNRSQLLENVWGYDEHGERVVEVHMSALRRKLKQQGAEPITTVHGVGYRLD